MDASIPNEPGSTAAVRQREFPYQKLLLAIFLLSLPLVNPTVHGDGVGYYAYARASLIQHNLRFEEDWRHANKYFSSARLQSDDRLRPNQYTSTGYVDNHFTIGPAIQWAPFLITAHVMVLTWNALGGGHISPDGFSEPYLIAMAVGTAIYGFLGLWLSFLLTKKYVQERWAFLATVGIWLASSLPVYMYFNPAWSHTHSAFSVAAFLWCWDRTRGSRTARQWIVLGLFGGLMTDVYFPNGVFLLLPFVEAMLAHWSFHKARDFRCQKKLLFAELTFVISVAVALVPTFITRRIVYGGFFRFGAYTAYDWIWTAPYWWRVLFSADHGALSWTPVLALSLIGLGLAPRNARIVAIYLAAAAAAFYYVIASYPYWDGITSFGNRFLISLTPIFVFGLALLLERWGRYWGNSGRAFSAAVALVILLSAWNAGFIFQWGEHLVPVRGAISFREMAHNQFFVVPGQLASHLRDYLFKRKDEMRKIEERDIEQLKNSPSP